MSSVATLRRALALLVCCCSLIVTGCGDTAATGANLPPGDDAATEGSDAAAEGADAATGADTGTAAVADASTPADAGSCSATGTCPTGNPCQIGNLACTPDGGTFCTATNLADGTACGAGQVCLAGACTTCAAGVACTENGNPCRVGVTSCATGKAECASVKDETDGTTCGANQVCSKGACTTCVPGTVCTNPADLCKQGTLSCTAGPVCNNATTVAPDGTSCGTNKACLTGICTCQPGGSCADPTNPCKAGAITCPGGAGGAPTCGNFTNVGDGTSCGTNKACLGGACTCQPGGSCADPTNPCKAGSITCTGGTPACGNFTNITNGTSCGTNQVCNAGACTACVSGGACLFGPCQVGTNSCATGVQTCANPKDSPNGTSCDPTPNTKVCSKGICVACVSGTVCQPGGNLCRAGVTSCASGSAVCTNVTDKPNGTSCGPNLFCNNGSCAACTAGSTCTAPGNACQVGTVTCSTGGPTCGGLTNAADNTPCGSNQVCKAGACTCANPCSNAGVAVCTSASSYQTCLRDPNGCFFLQPSNCPTGQACSGGVCSCKDTCTTAGQTQCASGTTIQMCTRNVNGCLSYQPVPAASCPGSTPACAAGACVCPARVAGQIYVSRNQGDDTFGNGSQTCPFRTVTKGVSVAAASSVAETINLAQVNFANGEAYDASIGEVFPIVVPANATLLGAATQANADSFVIVGVSAAAPAGAPTPAGTTTTLQMNGGKLSGIGVRASGGFGGQTSNAILVACNAGSPQIVNSTFRRAMNALYASGTCSASVSGSDINSNSAGNNNNAQIIITGTATASLSQNTIVNNSSGSGVAMNSQATGTSVFTGNDIRGNSQDGVRCGGKVVFTMQANTVSFNNVGGVRIGDLCSATLTGGTKDPTTSCGTQANTFRCNGGNQFRAGPDVISTAVTPVNADQNRWDHTPQPDSKDIVTNGQGGGVSAQNPCLGTQFVCP